MQRHNEDRLNDEGEDRQCLRAKDDAKNKLAIIPRGCHNYTIERNAIKRPSKPQRNTMRNGLDRETVEALLTKSSEHLKAMREGEGWISKRFDFSEASADLVEAGGWQTAYQTAGLRLTILFVAGVLGAISTMRWADLVTDAETDAAERKRKLSELDNQIRNRLLTQGFVQEIGTERTGKRGKPPTLYALTRKGAAIVATALGGSPTDALRALADANNSDLADRLADLYSRSVPSGSEPDFAAMRWTIEAGSNDGKLLNV